MADMTETRIPRTVTLARRIAAALALHKPGRFSAEHCEECHNPYPCDTARALGVDPAKDQILAEHEPAVFPKALGEKFHPLVVGTWCKECSHDRAYGGWVRYPCPTVQALFEEETA